jgi:hypothetical protein
VLDVGVVVVSGGAAGILVVARTVVLRERSAAAEHCGERRKSCKFSKSIHKFTSKWLRCKRVARNLAKT